MGSDEADRRTLAPVGRRTLTVARTEDVGAYRVLWLADPGGPVPRPGQFCMLAAADRWGGADGRPFLPRALSVLRARDGELGFMLEGVGPGTDRLVAVQAGEEVWVTGPLGLGWEAPHDGRRALLVGGGVGVPPLAGWQDELRARGIEQRALVGFRDARHAEAATLLHDARVATDDGSAGQAGFVTDLLRYELDVDAHVVVYACGPPPMLEAVRVLCLEGDVPGRLALEAGMACGFGACFGCVVETHDAGYVRICVDGPVVEASRLIPGAIR